MPLSRTIFEILALICEKFKTWMGADVLGSRCPKGRCLYVYMTTWSVDGPGVTNRSGNATVGEVYCQHQWSPRHGAINDHNRGGAVSIDAATLECTSVMKTGRTAAAAAGAL